MLRVGPARARGTARVRVRAGTVVRARGHRVQSGLVSPFCPPACPRPPRLPAGQTISSLIALQFTILPAKQAATRRPPRPLNLIPRRGRPLHRAPLRSGRHLKLTRRPARAHAGPTPACPRPPRLPAGQSISTLIALQFTLPRLPAPAAMPTPLAQRPGRL